MIEANGGQNQTQDLQPQADQKPSFVNRALLAIRQRWRPIAATFLWIAVAGTGFSSIWYYSTAFSNVDARNTFASTSIIGLCLLLSAMAQAFIYWGQRNIMNETLNQNTEIMNAIKGQLTEMQTNTRMQAAINDPRLRVVDIRANLKVGKCPVFVVTIANDGLIDANGVTFHLGVEMGPDRNFEWTDDQIISIAAKDSQTYYLACPSEILEQHIYGAFPLNVIGYFSIWNQGRKDFCYKFLTWEGERPEGVPEFVPCDRETGLKIGLAVGTGHLKLTGHEPTVIQEKAIPAGNHITPSGDVTNVVIHGDPLNRPQASEGKEKSGEAN
jgi:hypothetical protein